MNDSDQQEYVSIIGTSYLYPIIVLLEKLTSMGTAGPGELQASPAENGHSAAIIVLAVLFVESIINRAQYIQGEKPAPHPIKFVQTAFPKSGFAEVLLELFVVRDAIAHNHVWEARFLWDDQGRMSLIAAQLSNGYGDLKFKEALDPEGRQTRLLGINLFPTRVCLSDARKVLKHAFQFLLFLENKDRRYIYISDRHVRMGDRVIPFTELLSSL
jgi:hypothetical protein